MEAAQVGKINHFFNLILLNGRPIHLIYILSAMKQEMDEPYEKGKSVG
jgi:hypothetical protein